MCKGCQKGYDEKEEDVLHACGSDFVTICGKHDDGKICVRRIGARVRVDCMYDMEIVLWTKTWSILLALRRCKAET